MAPIEHLAEAQTVFAAIENPSQETTCCMHALIAIGMWLQEINTRQAGAVTQ